MIIFSNLSKVQQAWLKKQYPALAATFNFGIPSPKRLPPASTTVLSIHSNARITDALLVKLPNLRLIVSRTTGVDHIDLAACKRRGVAVANTAGQNAQSVAEFTFGLILAASRSIVIGNNRVVGGTFTDTGLAGTELSGKTLGVVGTGAIGAGVIRIAQGFGMKVAAYDFKKNTALQKSLNFEYMSLKQVVSRADIVTLHIPSTPLTHHIVNAALLAKMKRGVGLVNTSRGDVVDSRAITKALQSKKLSWYAADVLQGEQEKLTPEQKKFTKLPGVLITPHMAHATTESAERVLTQTVSLIQDFIKGKSIKTII